MVIYLSSEVSPKLQNDCEKRFTFVNVGALFYARRMPKMMRFFINFITCAGLVFYFK
jgi:hypothetical protein